MSLLVISQALFLCHSKLSKSVRQGKSYMNLSRYYSMRPVKLLVQEASGGENVILGTAHIVCLQQACRLIP